MIVQIVPHLPPLFEGLGGNALTLAGALAERFGIESSFVVGDPAWTGMSDVAAQALPARRADDLVAALTRRSDTVLLHYANYAYQSRGCPVWLAEGLLRWRSGAAGRRLVTSFHEVHASGPPWRSSFWLRPFQRRLAAAVTRCSDAMVTSLPLYREILRTWARGKEIALMPVFSAVGEPLTATPFLAERARTVVVFGGEGVRRRAYFSFQSDLSRVARAFDAEEIWDIGPAIDTPAAVAGIPVRKMGVLPPAEVSARLSNAVAGFVAYPPAFLAKSGIFAAYCAHGVLPICVWGQPVENGVPAAGRHYWNGKGHLPGNPQGLADESRDWYFSHSLEYQATVFRDLLAASRAHP